MPKDKDEASLNILKQLESLSPDSKDLLKPFRDHLALRLNAKQEAAVLGHVPTWIVEPETVAILRRTWIHMPCIRRLREYFAGRKAIKRAGTHGMVFYDSVVANELSDQYEPVSDHIDKISRAVSTILSRFDHLSIGSVRLIRRQQMGTFFKAVRKVDNKLSPYKTSKTGLTKRAKQNNENQAPGTKYAASP